MTEENNWATSKRVMVVANTQAMSALYKLVRDAHCMVVSSVQADRHLRAPADVRCDAVLLQAYDWTPAEVVAVCKHISTTVSAPIVLLCRQLDLELCRRARAAGVHGVLIMPVTAEQLAGVVALSVGDGRARNDRSGVHSSAPPNAHDELAVVAGESSLSNREVEVFRLLAQGYRANDIASMLFISSHTARKHTKTVFRKLGVHSQVELMRRCFGRVYLEFSKVSDAEARALGAGGPTSIRPFNPQLGSVAHASR